MVSAAFTPGRTAYKGRAGQPLTLVQGYIGSGFKGYWIEDDNGKRITPRYFFNQETVAGIIESAKGKQ